MQGHFVLPITSDADTFITPTDQWCWGIFNSHWGLLGNLHLPLKFTGAFINSSWPQPSPKNRLMDSKIALSTNDLSGWWTANWPFEGPWLIPIAQVTKQIILAYSFQSWYRGDFFIGKYRVLKCSHHLLRTYSARLGHHALCGIQQCKCLTPLHYTYWYFRHFTNPWNREFWPEQGRHRNSCISFTKA